MLDYQVLPKITSETVLPKISSQAALKPIKLNSRNDKLKSFANVGTSMMYRNDRGLDRVL